MIFNALFFRFLTRALPVLTLAVVVFGAYVRLTDAGLGCPDWPGCYGHLSVPEDSPGVHLEQAGWSTRPLESGKAWREMIHRYLASVLGLGVVLLAVSAFLQRPRVASGRLVFFLVPLICFQGMLGMWTVTLLLKPLVVTAHLFGGLTTLVLLWINLLMVERTPRVSAENAVVPAWINVGLIVLTVQIFLGAWTSTNYAALACTDFPTCHGSWWPDTQFSEAFTLWRGLGINYEFGVLDTPARTAIHVAHRLGALAAVSVILFVAANALRAITPAVRRCAWCILAFLSLQVLLGISNVVFGLPLAVAVAHNGVAALLLLSVVTLRYLIASRPGNRPYAQ